ncbi:nitrite/sulfite reductase [Prauserella cavernicola]|uniref:Precorrin-3B synthase n=1 Tax=Prauserella cavernicola TaxID=2800127 RepID=A0A934QUX8_9PSEU|nr:nitrite/sulfite reductase [Prauserella cavernicola]MBK1786935.1 precorrin-3B synthase [Prauserella cavernicola]
MAAPTRLRADACPGVVATHAAADGTLARVRLPGGALTGAQAVALADVADDLGDGSVHLTSRANLQLRAVRDADELVARLSAAGLLPSPSHERVRNILGSPLSGRSGGLTDVRPLVAELDRSVCANGALADLPGRFLFALDDGRGDVAGEGADVCWRATSAGEGAVLLDGADTGARVRAADVPRVLTELAAEFGRVRGQAWRVREVDPAPLVALALREGRETEPESSPLTGPAEVGRHGEHVVAAPRFGELPASELRELGELVVTPWRTLVLPGLTSLPAGTSLVTDPADPTLGVSACIGRPGCAKSRADVRADARVIASPGVRAHVSGCERRCGRPRGAHLDVVAVDEDGYVVDGTPVARAGLAAKLKGRQ